MPDDLSPSDHALSPTDYAFLILLKIENREISNTELDQLYGVRLISPNYEKLNGSGYVLSRTDSRPYKHSLAPKGATLLDRQLTITETDDGAKESKRTAKERQPWAALSALHAYHRQTPTAPTAAPASSEPSASGGRPLEGRLRNTYAQLADAPGEWVSLTKIRPFFDDVSKADLDQALRQLLDAPDVRLEPEPHRHRIDAQEKKASVKIGGEDRHKLAIGMR